MEIVLAFNFVVESCCSCGVAFAMPRELSEQLRETHRCFFCPNGHRQWYTGETEAEGLRKQLLARNEELERSRRALMAATEAEEKLRKRIAAGVCPCCRRTFQNLARHVATKHKNVNEVAPGAELRRPKQSRNERALFVGQRREPVRQMLRRPV